MGFLNNLKITHKINGSFVILILMVVGLVGFSFVNIDKLKVIFAEYNADVNESVILSALFEHLGEARISAYKYRIKDSAENEALVSSHIQKYWIKKLKLMQRLPINPIMIV